MLQPAPCLFCGLCSCSCVITKALRSLDLTYPSARVAAVLMLVPAMPPSLFFWEALVNSLEHGGSQKVFNTAQGPRITKENDKHTFAYGTRPTPHWHPSRMFSRNLGVADVRCETGFPLCEYVHLEWYLE